MADRIHPYSTKPSNGVQPPSPRPRPLQYLRPYHQRQIPLYRSLNRRRFCCSCCLWFALLLIAFVFLSTILFGAFFFMYGPHLPSFSLTNIHLSNTSMNVTVATRNPSQKLDFFYAPISVFVYSGDVTIGVKYIPGFVHKAGNTTVVRLVVELGGGGGMGRSGTLVGVGVETMTGIRVGGFLTQKIGIRVKCDGIKISSDKKISSCEAKVQIKIWYWYFF